MKHKASKYTFVFHGDNVDSTGRKILYNSRTGALAMIDAEDYAAFESFEKKETEIAKESLVEELKKGGFLVDNSIDEKKEIQLRLLAGRFHSSGLYLTVAPTADCNFRCPYCYEKEVLQDTSMTEETQAAIINFVATRIGQIKDLSITWYGGEPLLGLSAIRRMSKEFIKLCDENHVRYSAGMITNGYLLTREVAEELAKLKVTFYQITLDGDAETHNSRRYLADGGPTYHTILKNIVDSYDLLERVSLRVNVDKTNIGASDNIFRVLEEYKIGDKVKPYLGKVTGENPDIQEHCFTTHEFSKIDLDYTKRHQDILDWFGRYPGTRSNFCGADLISSFVIGADGLMYKCWDDIGQKSRAIGNVLNGIQMNSSVYYDYMLFDPFSDEKCSECKLLPVCMGGCPYRRSQGDSDNCSIYKTLIKEYISYFASMLLNEKKKNGTEVQ